MKTYIENIAGFMLLLSFVQMLTGESFRRETGFITGLMLLAALCAPLKGFVPDDISLPQIQTRDVKNYESIRGRLLKDAVKSSLEDEIKAQTGAERVSVELSEDNSVSYVTLYGADSGAREKTAKLCGIDEGRTVIENYGSEK